eukprot:878354-Rhodomonas_salina.1
MSWASARLHRGGNSEGADRFQLYSPPDPEPNIKEENILKLNSDSTWAPRGMLLTPQVRSRRKRERDRTLNSEKRGTCAHTCAPETGSRGLRESERERDNERDYEQEGVRRIQTTKNEGRGWWSRLRGDSSAAAAAGGGRGGEKGR